MSVPDTAASPTWLAKSITALAWTGVALAVVTLVRLSNLLGLGLELTDESYYLLGALHPASIHLFFTAAHWLTAPLWQLAGNLHAFRAMGLMLVAGSGLVLGWGAMRLAPLAGMSVPTRIEGRAAVMAAGVSGALLFGSLLSFTPSYNVLVTAAVGIAMGAGMASMASDGRQATLLEVLSGVVLGMAVLCKFSAGISTLAMLVVLQVAFLWRRQGWLRRPLVVIACTAITVIAVAAVATGPQEGWRQFRAGLDVIWVAQGDKGMLPRLLRSAADIGTLFTGMAMAFWAPLACFAVAMFWRPWLAGSLGAVWFAGSLWLR